MFEKTLAAIDRAKEHVGAAETLAEAGFFSQAYAHTALALEESSVAGIRLVTESGIISWSNPPEWFRVKEKDLSSLHARKLRLGLLIAMLQPAFLDQPLPLESSDPGSIYDDVPRRLRESIQTIMKLLSDATFVGFLRNGQKRKEAAFYSTGKNKREQSPLPPDEKEYRSLARIAHPYVKSLTVNWPAEDDLAPVIVILRGMLASLFETIDVEWARAWPGIRGPNMKTASSG
jgi:AbiV family abortive infection protein